jgi:hypothetical protein
VTLTARTVAIGLIAWCLAFLIAFPVNPVHPGVYDPILLILSGVAGCLVALALGRRFRHSKSHQGAAVLVFAITFFVGIYAPISAIWANAPFYSWASVLKRKPKTELTAPMLITAIERTAVSTYGGALLLLVLGYAIARWAAGRQESAVVAGGVSFSRLGWVDAVFGFAALAFSLPAALWVSTAAGSQINGLALLELAFLQCFLFRSMRLECRSLWEQPPRTTVRQMSRSAGVALILCLVICALASFCLFEQSSSQKLTGKELGIALICDALLLLPLLLFRLIRSEPIEDDRVRSASYNHFAVNCGVWTGIGLTLLLGGLVLTGIARKELTSVSGLMPTPFALAITAFTPVFPAGGFLAFLVTCGGLFTALILPSHSARACDRVLAGASGGAAAGAIFFVSLIIIALDLALCTVPYIPGVKEPPDPFLKGLLFVDGNWSWLGVYYLSAFLFTTLAGASIWAMQAVLACGLIWIKDRF